MTMLEIDVRLHKKGFDLDVELRVEGERFGVVGPSGSGKTTLLRVVAGLEPEASGRVRFRGERWQGPDGTFRAASSRGVGWLPQDALVFPPLDARENLRYADPDEAEFRRIVEALELGDRLDVDAGKLSGGERQRVALGRALLSEPRLLLLDEPFSALDRNLTDRIVAMLDEWCAERQAGLLVAAHSSATVEPLTDEFARISQGRLEGEVQRRG